MSIAIVRCKNCNALSYPPDAVTCRLELNKHSHCGSCHHGHDDKHSYLFCSPGCLMIWVAAHAVEFLQDVARLRSGHKGDVAPDSGMNPQPDPKIAEHWHEIAKPEVMHATPSVVPPAACDGVDPKINGWQIVKPEVTYVPPVDPNKVAKTLEERAADFKKEIARIEEMKKVSSETMSKVIGSSLKKPEEFFTDPKPSAQTKDEIMATHPCCPTHCCVRHGCKYGHKDCPVVLGYSVGVSCDKCDFDADQSCWLK